MPTKKRRIGFIPRSEVLDLINKLSYESNLSNSKIISILVEEALYKRGMFSIKTGKVLEKENKDFENIKQVKINNVDKNISSNLKDNFSTDENLVIKEWSEDHLDKDIYAKFLMFLQFQERMKQESYK